ncbi:MAG: 9-O-acetylesterase [Prevotella sp.]|nr:9-O-acetylesterase [Prevotella sp.]
MNKKMILTTLLAATAVCVQAKVKLPHLLSDNMVIQQQTDVRLWGWAKAGSKVVATTSWNTERSEAKADKQGRWLLTVKSPKASYEPLSISIDDGDGAVTVSNVLAGEVWVCAGQSNMEMPVRGFGQCPVQNYNQEVVSAAGKRQVRSAKIPSIMRMTPQEDADTHWRECSPQTVSDFSATGYFFAKMVNKALDIPVGLIEANKGGSRVESWLTKENLEKYTKEPTDTMGIVNFKKDWDYHRAMVWGNGTFNPILNYTVKGILFYQGCSNVGDPGNQYSERLKLLVEQWRQQFRLGDIPFYFVQIAPYDSGDKQGTWNALLQEQQFRASKIIPNSGLVCTNDCVFPYEGTQIHPAQKQKVGERLALQALNKTYGMTSLICESPSFKDMQVKGDTVMIHLDNECGGISRFEDIVGFEVAGSDRVFHPAKAAHFWQPGGGYWDECIVITSSEVKQPVAVRYCFRNWLLGNLGNQGGLPLFPFRTDNW